MKKRILFYLILVLIGFKSFGQTTLLTEGWNGAGPSGWGIGLISGYVEFYDMTTGQFPTIPPIEGARLLEFESHTSIIS
jgi:hypothetical protein